jgi:hypothetical protein
MLRGTKVLTVITGCMDLCWLYAWAEFATFSLIPGVLPLPACAAVFWAAAVLAMLTGNRGWRVITAGMFQAGGLLAGVLLVLHGTLAAETPVWQVAEWFEAIGAWDVPFSRCKVAAVCFWAVCFWVGGARLARRPASYYSVTSRFDLGLGAFFVLFLIQLLVQVKYGAQVHQHIYRYLMLSFFAFGVYAVGLARDRTDAVKSYRGGRRGTGLLLGFLVLVLFGGAGSALLVLTYLSQAAGTVYTGIRAAGAHLEPIVTKIIKFIFSPMASGMSVGGEGATIAPPLTVPEARGRLPVFGLVLLYALLGFMSSLGLFILGKSIWSAILRLLSRTRRTKGVGPGFTLQVERLLAWWRAVFRLLFRRGEALGVIELYTQMAAWGKRIGMPRAFHETPLEYGSRLAGRFPEAGGKFGRIVNAFNLTVYGGVPEEFTGLQKAQGGWRRLMRLWIWMVRLKSLWRVQPGTSQERK